MTVTSNMSGNSAEFSPTEPTFAEIQSALSKNLIQAIPSAALALGAMYLMLTLAHSALLAPEHKQLLVPIAGISALIFFSIYFLTRNDGASPDYAHGFAGLFGILGLGNSLLHVAITGDPLQSSNIMLVVVAIGAFFLSRRWFWFIVLSAVVGWGAIANANQLTDVWTHFGIGMVMTVIVAVVINSIRHKTHHSLFALQIQQDRHRENLETVQQSLEERVEARTTELNELNLNLNAEIARRRNTEKQLKESEQSLIEQRNMLQVLVDRQTEELRAANQRLRETDKLKSTMMDDIRYEIHPQLNEMKARIRQLELSLRGSLEKRHIDLFANVHNIAGNMETSLNSMRAVSRMRTADVSMRPEHKETIPKSLAG